MEGWRLVAVLEQTHVEEGRRTVPKPEAQQQGYGTDPQLYELTEPVLVTRHAYVIAKSKDDTILTLVAEKQGVDAANHTLHCRVEDLESTAREVLQQVDNNKADLAVWNKHREGFLEQIESLQAELAEQKKQAKSYAKEAKAFVKALSSRDAQIARCWAEFGGSRMRELFPGAESPVPEPPGPTRHEVLASD